MKKHIISLFLLIIPIVVIGQTGGVKSNKDTVYFASQQVYVGDEMRIESTGAKARSNKTEWFINKQYVDVIRYEYLSFIENGIAVVKFKNINSLSQKLFIYAEEWSKLALLSKWQIDFAEKHEFIIKQRTDILYWPYQPEYGDLQSRKFGINSVDLPGIQYEWRAPEGWKINGGGNTLITSSNIVEIKPTHFNSHNVAVRLRHNGDISEWFSGNFKGFTRFDGNIQDRTVEGEMLFEKDSITVKDVTVKKGAILTVNGSRSVRILPGFIAESGSNIRIYNGATALFTVGETKGDSIIETKFLSPSKRLVLDELVSSKLYQNSPNPAKGYTTINSFVPENIKKACIQFYNMMGSLVLRIPITSIGQNSIDVNTTELTNGVYMYSLIVDDCLIDTKRMVVAN